MAGIARSPSDPEVQSTGPSSLGASDRLARGLGWFSIGLGALEIFGAERLAWALGLRGREWLIRAFGAREIASGMVSLSANPNPGIASRIAGDALDILVLLSALRRDNPRRENVEAALLAVVGITVLDVICQKGLVARHARPQRGWRDYSNRSGFPKGLAAARGAAQDRAGPLSGPSAGV
ncbi:hypothetical protein J8J14_24065 [Roseomonas sp. SSH11]|uniref:DUF1622 domain-containing protein n=1 Tax=Pararoseomonas baculiformis TaxID=2820812 RepID=A0ABS4ALB7_9PROT|nr:hypothetical protein [Pararoseomonas baculiformis]MBP0447822.1 hypothetical protein [Pararoseomonas baculiformis]